MVKKEKKEEFYAEELKEKDKIIEQLKADNRILLESSLKKAEDIEELKLQMEKLIALNKSLIKKKAQQKSRQPL